MPKQYPPVIAGTLPAFTLEKENENLTKAVIKIPFAHNRAVGIGTISGFALKIKDIQNNNIVYTAQVSKDTLNNENDLELKFEVLNANQKFKAGTFYKAQIAYVVGDEIGYYSTVGVIKCTTKPQVTIEDLTDKENDSKSTYLGHYSQQNQDATEKVYSYKFTIYDTDKQTIFETTDELIHNHQHDDEIYESIDIYEPRRALKDNHVYYIQYSGITTNDLEFVSPMYQIVQNRIVNPSSNIQIVAENNYENGYITINLIGDKDPETGKEKQAFGNFTLYRSSSEDNFDSFSKICNFELHGTLPSLNSWKDFTVKHGETYRYSIEQYNKKGVYSNKIYSNDVVAGFEDSFLYDGERQMRIRFNPKVSSFKETVLESKQDTIGNQYPYFFRNGNVRYKEFSINGLLSYLMDNDELFMPRNELYIDENLLEQRGVGIVSSEPAKRVFDDLQVATTNLVDYNVTAERIFKLKALEWLNNGKPKLFRSPQEGNYIVRLMNCSLTPNDVVGRMLHTFQATAYEIDDYETNNLSSYGLQSFSEDENISYMNWKTVDVQDYFAYHSDYDTYDNIYPDELQTVLHDGDSVKFDLPIPIPDVTYVGFKADILSAVEDTKFSVILNGRGIADDGKLHEAHWGVLAGTVMNLKPNAITANFKPYDKIVKLSLTIDNTDITLQNYEISNIEVRLEGDGSAAKNIRIIYTQGIEKQTIHTDATTFTAYKDAQNADNSWQCIGEKIVSLQCHDMIPGDQIILSNKPLQDTTNIPSDATIISIGATGTYMIDNTGEPVWVYIKYLTTHQGKITMGFYNQDLEDTESNKASYFDYYDSISNADICLRQFIGSSNGADIKEQLEDVKIKVINYRLIHFVKRPIVDLSFDGTNYFYNGKQLKPDPDDAQIGDGDIYDLNDTSIYCVYESNKEPIYYDGAIGLIPEGIIPNLSFEVQVDDKIIDLNEIKEYTYTANGTPKIVLSSGVILDLSAECKTIGYSIEQTNDKLITLWEQYERLNTNVENLIRDIERVKESNSNVYFTDVVKLVPYKNTEGAKIETKNIGSYKLEQVEPEGKEQPVRRWGDDVYEQYLYAAKRSLEYQRQLYVNKLEQLLKSEGAV